jgi:hypothetical protein
MRDVCVVSFRVPLQLGLAMVSGQPDFSPFALRVTAGRCPVATPKCQIFFKATNLVMNTENWSRFRTQVLMHKHHLIDQGKSGRLFPSFDH